MKLKTATLKLSYAGLPAGSYVSIREKFDNTYMCFKSIKQTIENCVGFIPANLLTIH